MGMYSDIKKSLEWLAGHGKDRNARQKKEGMSVQTYYVPDDVLAAMDDKGETADRS